MFHTSKILSGNGHGLNFVGGVTFYLLQGVNSPVHLMPTYGTNVNKDLFHTIFLTLGIFSQFWRQNNTLIHEVFSRRSISLLSRLITPFKGC